MTGIVIAPFSNSDIRDWPPEHFAALIGTLIERGPRRAKIRVVGTANQRLKACDITRSFDPAVVSNDCGRLSWAALLDELRSAVCVIGNNSGIAHLSGSFGVPTVCVFGGSHQRLEWHPLGREVVVLSRTIACSPCHLDHGASCLYDKACLRQIEPSVVADAALSLIAQHDRPARTECFSKDNAAMTLVRNDA